MKNSNIHKRIDNLVELRKNLWTAFIILTGGITALMINLDTFIKMMLLAIGVLAEISLITTIIRHNQNIEILLKKLDSKE